jgi:PAS domain S-box-containing protein
VRADYRDIVRERVLGREGGELRSPVRREYPFVTPDGRTVWLDIAAARIEFEGQPAVLACGLDLTDRKRAEQFLQSSEERFRTLFESAPIGIALHAPNGRYVQVNRAYCEMLGYPMEELLRLGPRRVTHPEDVPEGRRLYQELLAGKRDHYGREKRYRHRTGQLVWAFSAASAVRDSDGRLRYIVSMVLDITERKRLQGEILEISARERRRLGYNLHDGLGQHLSGTAFKAKCLEEALAEAAPAHAAAAEEIVQLINRAISQTRALARGLDPIEVEVGGLVSALQGLASETEKLFAIRCRFSCNCPTLPLEAPQALHLFHIVQEAINNAARHGEARHIDVELAADNGQLRLAIRDDGKGFPTGPQPATGLGMRTMRYRADSIGASLRVRSRPVRGVEVECVLAAPPPVESTGEEP